MLGKNIKTTSEALHNSKTCIVGRLGFSKIKTSNFVRILSCSLDVVWTALLPYFILLTIITLYDRSPISVSCATIIAISSALAAILIKTVFCAIAKKLFNNACKKFNDQNKRKLVNNKELEQHLKDDEIKAIYTSLNHAIHSGKIETINTFSVDKSMILGKRSVVTSSNVFLGFFAPLVVAAISAVFYYFDFITLHNLYSLFISIIAFFCFYYVILYASIASLGPCAINPYDMTAINLLVGRNMLLNHLKNHKDDEHLYISTNVEKIGKTNDDNNEPNTSVSLSETENSINNEAGTMTTIIAE